MADNIKTQTIPKTSFIPACGRPPCFSTPHFHSITVTDTTFFAFCFYVLFLFSLKLFLCVSTAGVLEQGQASQHLSHRQFSVDFVVPRANVDTVRQLLLLSHHCQKKPQKDRSFTGVHCWHIRQDSANFSHSIVTAPEVHLLNRQQIIH